MPGISTCLLACSPGFIIVDQRKLRSSPAPHAIATVTSWKTSPAGGVAQQTKQREQATRLPSRTLIKLQKRSKTPSTQTLDIRAPFWANVELLRPQLGSWKSRLTGPTPVLSVSSRLYPSSFAFPCPFSLWRQLTVPAGYNGHCCPRVDALDETRGGKGPCNVMKSTDAPCSLQWA